MPSARRFPTACVASPHHLASAAGLEILAAGGNAVDAAVATGLALGVVAPYTSGPGGDLFAIVADRDAVRGTYASAGRAPRGATPKAVRSAADGNRMPQLGALTVTVPGAVAGWWRLVEEHGGLAFGELAAPAIRLARQGYVLSDNGAAIFERGRERYADFDGWMERFGHLSAGDRLVQPGLADLYAAIGDDGPEAFYGGRHGRELVEVLQAGGSTMKLEDLAAHEVERVTPLRVPFGELEILELPPPTQGVTAGQALRVVDHLGLPEDPVLRTHLQIEAIRGALHDRSAHVTDPDHMSVTTDDLLDEERIAALADAIDPDKAGSWPPATPAPGGTAYLCAADGDGLAVSLIQSHFMGFGSGIVHPTSGVNLQNRGAQFSLKKDHVNVVAPGKRTLHTLIPSVALREGRPWLVFGTMGGDGQPQVHLQVYSRIVDGMGPGEALAAPRWLVSALDGSVTIESGADLAVLDGLRARGHDVAVLDAGAPVFGHAHLIRMDPDGYTAVAEPRTQAAALGR